MDDLIGRLKRLIQKAPTAGVPVFYAQHHNPNGFPAYGSPDWQLITETGPQVGEVGSSPCNRLSYQYSEEVMPSNYNMLRPHMSCS